MDKPKFTTFASFTDRIQAEICAGMLRDNGIPAGVFGADSSYPSLGYVKAIEVKVNEDDREQALKLIEEQ